MQSKGFFFIKTKIRAGKCRSRPERPSRAGYFLFVRPGEISGCVRYLRQGDGFSDFAVTDMPAGNEEVSSAVRSLRRFPVSRVFGETVRYGEKYLGMKSAASLQRPARAEWFGPAADGPHRFGPSAGNRSRYLPVTLLGVSSGFSVAYFLLSPSRMI